MPRKTGRPERDEDEAPQMLDADEKAAAFRQAREAKKLELFEDYAELIDGLIRENGEARQVDIAAHLGVAQPTVARTLKRMAQEGLVQSRPYRGVFLTDEGTTLAHECRRRHETVERFLVDLGVSPETARRDAEGLEHHVSEETLEAFRAFSAQRRG